MFEYLSKMVDFDIIANKPDLQTLKGEIYNIPQIKTYLESRTIPQINFPSKEQICSLG